MKTCNKCHVEKPKSEFYKKSTASDGLFWWCRDCHKVYVKAKYALAYTDKDFAAKENARVRKHLKDNPEKDHRRWPTGAEAIANNAKYKHGKAKRTPKWLDTNEIWMMEEAYILAALRTKMFGFPWEVDHIIPLRGKLASGLHVPHNLQVIPKVLNRSKSNQFMVN